MGLRVNWPTVADVLLNRYFNRSSRLSAAPATVAFVSLFKVRSVNGAVLAEVIVVCAALAATVAEGCVTARAAG